MRNFSLAIVIVSLASALSPLRAQDDKPIVTGPFENNGSVTFGYRATSVSGYTPMYRNLFDLNSGFRVLNFDLYGHAKPEAKTFADDYSVTTSGFGGEPWSTTQISVSKKHRYELRAGFRQSYYYIDPDSLATSPSGLHGLLSDHNWQTVRKMGSLNLLVHATNNLKFNFEYARNTRNGGMDTTRTMDYFGSPSSWGSFARANPYYLVGLLDERTNRIAGGVDYTVRDWTFHYKAGWQHFSDSFTGTNPSADERSINIDDPTTAKELLTSAQWNDNHKFSTPSSEFSWNGTLAPRLRTFGSYIFFDYSGPAAIAISAAGLQRGATTSVIVPYSFTDTSTVTVREPNHIVHQGFSWEANDWLSMEASYRYNRLHVNADEDFTSIASCCVAAAPATTQTGSELNEWIIGTSTADLDVILTPAHSLVVRLGIGYLKRDVKFISDGLTDPLTTQRAKTVLPTMNISYQPNKVFSVRANIDEINNGSSYTRETPHTDIGSRIVTRVRPVEKFWIENTTQVRDRQFLTVNYTSRVRDTSTTLTYELNERAAGFAGFSYDSFYSQNYVNFLRGTAPFTNLSMTDQSIERLWQAGVNLVPVRRMELRFAGNFVSVNGLGVVAGEKPFYGPVKFPTASGSLSYDFPKTGKLTLQLQRTYYEEQIIPGNNFSANILLVAYTRSF